MFITRMCILNKLPNTFIFPLKCIIVKQFFRSHIRNVQSKIIEHKRNKSFNFYKLRKTRRTQKHN